VERGKSGVFSQKKAGSGCRTAMWSCLAKALGFVGAGEEKSGRRPSQAKRG